MTSPDHHAEMEAHATEMQRRDDLEFINSIEAGLCAIARLRLDDLPKTGGKTALMRLQYAICCAKDTLTRSGPPTAGPRFAAERRAVEAEMRSNGNRLETSWQQERLIRARDADRLAGMRRSASSTPNDEAGIKPTSRQSTPNDE